MNMVNSFNYSPGKCCFSPHPHLPLSIYISKVLKSIKCKYPLKKKKKEVVRGSRGKKGFLKYALSQQTREQRDSKISQPGFDLGFRKMKP